MYERHRPNERLGHSAGRYAEVLASFERSPQQRPSRALGVNSKVRHSDPTADRPPSSWGDYDGKAPDSARKERRVAKEGRHTPSSGNAPPQTFPGYGMREATSTPHGDRGDRGDRGNLSARNERRRGTDPRSEQAAPHAGSLARAHNNRGQMSERGPGAGATSIASAQSRGVVAGERGRTSNRSAERSACGAQSKPLQAALAGAEVGARRGGGGEACTPSWAGHTHQPYYEGGAAAWSVPDQHQAASSSRRPDSSKSRAPDTDSIPEYIPPRPGTPNKCAGSWGHRIAPTSTTTHGGCHSARGERRPEPQQLVEEAPDRIPPRPTTPCMNKGSSTRRTVRTRSAGATSRRARAETPQALGTGESDGRSARAAGAASTSRPTSGRSTALAGAAPANLIEEAIQMCRNAKSLNVQRNQPQRENFNARNTQDTVDGGDGNSSSPERFTANMPRPTAPTPEQTNHWLAGMDGEDAIGCDGEPAQQTQVPSAPSSRSGSPDSPRNDFRRPRSPTPTKMLAWEEEERDANCVGRDGSDDEGRGDHTDGLIARLICACQMNEIDKAFTAYGKLQRMQVPLYEGVYTMLIECCMRTQQLGHAMQFYETLKSSKQRISSRLVTLLMEACAKEQHGDKVYAIWGDWGPKADEHFTSNHLQVLLTAVSALIRTMSPDLAGEILSEAMRRSVCSPKGIVDGLEDAEVEIEELLQLNSAAAEDCKANGTMLNQLTEQFADLHAQLSELLERSLAQRPASLSEPFSPGNGLSGFDSGYGGMAANLIMEDVDLDLELAAM